MADDTSHFRKRTVAGFQPTRWTEIWPPGEVIAGTEEARKALCEKYWPPIYAFLRTKRKSPHDAEDLTQSFFAHLLTDDQMKNVHPTKGKFRSFLLACLGHYVENIRVAGKAQRRGGGQEHVPLNMDTAETHYQPEPADFRDPAKIYERRWALTLIEGVLQRLKEDYQGKGKTEFINALLPHLNGDAERGDYSAAAVKLQMSEPAVRTAVSRLRGDFRDLLRSEVALTVEDPAEIDDEIRYLITASQRL
jgi:DNA-directed RNA polymerase specialized sigma24 family protein